MFKKAHPITDLKSREKWKSEGDHSDRCQVCHAPWNCSGWRGLVIHHIIHGSNGRSDEPCNFLLVCGRCHDMIHDGNYRNEKTKELLPAITLGNVLWVKSHTDGWNEKRLTKLYHRNLPSWDILPAFYMEERCRWNGHTMLL